MVSWKKIRERSTLLWEGPKQIPFEELWKTDHERAKLSADPANLFLKHPAGETPEDYQSEISGTIWNSPSWDDREPTNYRPDFDATVNPLKGLLKNE